MPTYLGVKPIKGTQTFEKSLIKFTPKPNTSENRHKKITNPRECPLKLHPASWMIHMQTCIYEFLKNIFHYQFIGISVFSNTHTHTPLATTVTLTLYKIIANTYGILPKHKIKIKTLCIPDDCWKISLLSPGKANAHSAVPSL